MLNTVYAEHLSGGKLDLGWCTGLGGPKRNVSPVYGYLGDSPCTLLLVSPWLGEVVGASLAMG